MVTSIIRGCEKEILIHGGRKKVIWARGRRKVNGVTAGGWRPRKCNTLVFTLLVSMSVRKRSIKNRYIAI